MDSITEQDILSALKAVIEPKRRKDIVDLGMISGLVVKDGNVGFAIEVDPKDGAAMEPLRKAAESAVEALPGVLSVTAVLTAHSGGAARDIFHYVRYPHTRVTFRQAPNLLACGTTDTHTPSLFARSQLSPQPHMLSSLPAHLAGAAWRDAIQRRAASNESTSEDLATWSATQGPARRGAAHILWGRAGLRDGPP